MQDLITVTSCKKNNMVQTKFNKYFNRAINPEPIIFMSVFICSWIYMYLPPLLRHLSCCACHSGCGHRNPYSKLHLRMASPPHGLTDTHGQAVVCWPAWQQNVNDKIKKYIERETKGSSAYVHSHACQRRCTIISIHVPDFGRNLGQATCTQEPDL